MKIDRLICVTRNKKLLLFLCLAAMLLAASVTISRGALQLDLASASMIVATTDSRATETAARNMRETVKEVVQVDTVTKKSTLAKTVRIEASFNGTKKDHGQWGYAWSD